MSIPQHLRHQPKVQATYHQLLHIIDGLQANEKLPTANELRDQLGVSNETLNQALRELEGQHLIYRIRGVGIFVLPQRRSALLVEPSFFYAEDISPFWRALIDKILEHAAINNQQLELHFAHPIGYHSERLPAALEAGLDSQRLSAVIAIGVWRDLIDQITTRAASVSFAAWGPYTVGLNSQAMITAGTEELVGRGCRRIAFWRPAHPWRDIRRAVHEDFELRFFQSQIEKAQLTYEPQLMRFEVHLPREEGMTTIVSHRRQGYEIAHRVFGRGGGGKPDGILINDDQMAIGAIQALDELGIEVGKDVVIASHANASLSQFPDGASVILLEFDLQEIVEALFGILEEQFSGKSLSQKNIEVRPTVRYLGPAKKATVSV